MTTEQSQKKLSILHSHAHGPRQHASTHTHQSQVTPNHSECLRVSDLTAETQATTPRPHPPPSKCKVVRGVVRSSRPEDERDLTTLSASRVSACVRAVEADCKRGVWYCLVISASFRLPVDRTENTLDDRLCVQRISNQGRQYWSYSVGTN
jgi:hypothetical protein